MVRVVIGTRPSFLLAAATLGVTAPIAIWFGASSLGTGLTFAGRLTGTLVIAGGLVMATSFIAAIDLYRSVPHRFSRYPRPARSISAPLVVVGALAVFGFAAMMAFTQVWSGDPGITLSLWVGLALLSAFALYLLRAHIPSPFANPRRFAAGLTVTTLITMANFAYSQIYVPASQLPTISVKPAFGTGSRAEGELDVAVPVTVTIKAGSTRVYLLAATYAIEGTKTAVQKSERDVQALRADIEANNDPSINAETQANDFLQAGHLLTPGSELAPGDELTISKVVHLPIPVGYSSLRLSAHLNYFRADRARLHDYGAEPTERSFNKTSYQHTRDGPDWVTGKGDDYVLYSGILSEGNEIFKRTRKKVYVCFWWVMPKSAEGRPIRPETVFALSYADPTNRQNKNFDGRPGTREEVRDRVYERYSFWYQDTSAVIPTEELKVPLS